MGGSHGCCSLGVEMCRSPGTAKPPPACPAQSSALKCRCRNRGIAPHLTHRLGQLRHDRPPAPPGNTSPRCLQHPPCARHRAGRCFGELHPPHPQRRREPLPGAGACHRARPCAAVHAVVHTRGPWCKLMCLPLGCQSEAGGMKRMVPRSRDVSLCAGTGRPRPGFRHGRASSSRFCWGSFCRDPTPCPTARHIPA